MIAVQSAYVKRQMKTSLLTMLVLMILMLSFFGAGLATGFTLYFGIALAFMAFALFYAGRVTAYWDWVAGVKQLVREETVVQP